MQVEQDLLLNSMNQNNVVDLIKEGRDDLAPPISEPPKSAASSRSA